MAEAPIVTRIRAAAAEHDRARLHLKDTAEVRNKLIVEAADMGVSYTTIARAADISKPGVAKVLATPHVWLEQL